MNQPDREKSTWQDLTLWRVDLKQGQPRTSVKLRDVEGSPTSGFSSPGFAFTTDGKEVVFSTGGNLMRLDVQTGDLSEIRFKAHVRKVLGPLTARPVRLDYGPLKVRQILSPHFSPDGYSMVFSAVGKVWLRRSDGASIRLTARKLDNPIREFDPIFSPDGRWIAFATWSEDEGGQLWKVSSSGGTAVALLGSPQANRVVGAPRWSPDSRRLAFPIGTIKFSPISERFAQPSGRELSADSAIGWVDATAGSPHSISGSGISVLPIGASHSTYELSFSADGKRLFFWDVIRGESQTITTNLKSMTFPPVVAEVSAIEIKGADGVQYNVQGAPSPDGKWLAVEVSGEVLLIRFVVGASSNQKSIEVSNLCTERFCSGGSGSSKVIQLTQGGGFAPVWSDDGEWLSWHYRDVVYRAKLIDLASHGRKARIAKVIVDLTVDRNLPKRPLLLRGGRAVTMDLKGVIENADILLAQGRIVAVGPQGSFPTPNDAEVRDVSGKTIVPGFIGLQDTKVLLSGLAPFSDDNRAGLAFGITTGWTPGAGSQLNLSAEEARQVGNIAEKRNLQPGCNVKEPNSFFMSNEHETFLAFNRCAHLDRDRMQEIYTPTTRLQRQWAVMAGAKIGTPISAELTGFYTRVAEMLDGIALMEHGFGVGPLHRDIIELVVRSGTAWNADTNFLDAKNARNVLRAGGTVGLSEENAPIPISHNGSKFEPGNFGAVGAMLLFMHSDAQTSPMEGLEYLTMGPARALGLQEDLGSIRAGKIADLVVLDCDPLQDPFCVAKPSWVIQDGWLYKASTEKRVTGQLSRLNH